MMNGRSPATSTRTLPVSLALLALSCLCCLPSIAGAAIVVGIQPTAVNPGDSADITILLSGGDGLVSGMQVDMAWDSNCMTVASGGGDEAACTANTRETGKNIQTKVSPSGASMRALFFSLSDVKPIARDTWLFNCQFNISSSTTATQCPITLSNLIVSDSKGGRLPATPANGVIGINQTQAQPQLAPGQGGSMPPPVFVAPGVGGGGSTGQPQGVGAAPSGAAPASGARPGAMVAPNAPAPAAPEADGGAPEVAPTPGLITPSPVHTVAAASTPTPRSGTPKASTKTVAPQTTATPPASTPVGGTPTPKSGAK